MIWSKMIDFAKKASTAKNDYCDGGSHEMPAELTEVVQKAHRIFIFLVVHNWYRR